MSTKRLVDAIVAALSSDPNTNCVCGHPKEDHVRFVMSGELVNPSRENNGMGHYTMNVGLFQNNIFTVRQNATYESMNCGCGCTIFEADNGD